MKLIGPTYQPTQPAHVGTRRAFTKFVFTHGHARNVPFGSALEEPIPRMKLAVVTTSWWAQWENWQPNTDIPGPICVAEDALLYHEWLKGFTPGTEKKVLRHNVVLKLTARTTYEILNRAKKCGFYVVKIYPDGVTTNSEGGWSSLTELYPAIQSAVELGFIVMFHGEQPGEDIDTYAREIVFMEKSFKQVAKDFAGANLDVQHISCKRTLEMVGEMPANITGGLTIHHLILTRNDVLEWKKGKRRGMNPHNHCRPPAQQFHDRDALLYAALHADETAYRKFHLGPDSAPHHTHDKECDCGCAGLCTSPNAGPVLVELYENNDRLDHPSFHAFTIGNGARIFNVQVDPSQTFTLEKGLWAVPEKYGGVTPFWAGRELQWKPIEPMALNPSLLLS